MVLNRNHALQYPNTLSDSIQIQNFRKSFLLRNKRKPSHVAECVISNPAGSQSYQAPKTVVCHIYKYLAAIFCSRFFSMWVWHSSVSTAHSLCVWSASLRVFTFTRRCWSNSSCIGKMQSYLDKTKVLQACDGESLHLPDEPELIISFYFCSLAGSRANSAGSCTALLALQE